MPRGEKNKLTQQQRIEIYEQKGKISGYKVATQYGVTHTTIYNIWGRQPPKSHTHALRKIIMELNRTRGFPMDDHVMEMWININKIATQALGEA